MNESKRGRNQSLGWIQLGVAATIAAAYATGARAPQAGIEHPILVVLVAETVAILLLFACSRMAGNSGFVDPHWSLAPILVALYFALVRSAEPGHEPILMRQMVVVPLVACWGVRLTHNWQRGFLGFAHEDWRYAKLRDEFGRRYWMVELGGIHVFQMLLTFLGCLSLYSALAVGARPLGPLDAMASAITLLAIWIEMTADRQLHDFVGGDREPGEVLRDGLWRYSRHPNYFGEILFWWGLYLFALAADPSYWWTIVGPLCITSMFLFVSLPLIEERQAERRAGYREYAQEVSMLIPWFERRSRS